MTLYLTIEFVCSLYKTNYESRNVQKQGIRSFNVGIVLPAIFMQLESLFSEASPPSKLLRAKLQHIVVSSPLPVATVDRSSPEWYARNLSFNGD